MRLTSRIQVTARIPLLQVTKVAVATVLAWFAAQLIFPSELPIFAAIAALLVVQPSVNQSLGRALERCVGVIVGVVIAFTVGVTFGHNSWIVLLGIVLSIFIGWAFRLTPASANQIPISAMLVLSIGATTPEYAGARIIETVLGAVVGLIVNVTIAPPVLLMPAHDAVSALGRELAATIDRLAHALGSVQTQAQLEELLLNARLLRPMQVKATDAIQQGEDSLAFNPRRSRHRTALEGEAALFARLTPLVTRMLGMTRALRDHYDDGLHEEPTVRAIAVELERAAHDLRLLVRDEDTTSGAEPPTTTSELPALTAPLVIATPHPQHWILIGSLMEDLRRVREEILDE
ncbi:FUSC family protein [Luethyella okanaganae]|uniref:Aromatic acid exporter family protein n=1 Tax=Luethyella okanaganae TaxID=69372 RepID=A0ABW1VFC6_9MICO